MERLQILSVGVQSILELFLRNLHTRFFTPVVLLVLNSFNILRIYTELTFSNLRVFFTEINFFVTGTLKVFQIFQ